MLSVWLDDDDDTCEMWWTSFEKIKSFCVAQIFQESTKEKTVLKIPTEDLGIRKISSKMMPQILTGEQK